jgi:hypothetical protein
MKDQQSAMNDRFSNTGGAPLRAFEKWPSMTASSMGSYATERDMLHDSSDEAGLHYSRFCFNYNVFIKTLFPSGPQEYRQKK